MIIILLLIRRSSNYISTDAVADYHYTFVNIGYDIAGSGYTLVQAPGDVDRSADDLNTKIWTNPGSIGAYTTAQIYGVRKELQVEGHGMVEYIIANTPPTEATITIAIDKVTYNTIEYVIPDHIILRKSLRSPVLFTCPPGQGTVTGDTCVACTGSQWSDGTAPCAAWTGPTTCPAGYGFTAATASNDGRCTACTGSQYSIGGTNACANWTITSCPAGSGFTAGDASRNGSCAACSGIQYSTGGTNACADWSFTATTCGNNIFTSGRADANTTCTACSPAAVLGTKYYTTSTGCSLSSVTSVTCASTQTLVPATLTTNNSCKCSAGYYGTTSPCSLCPNNTTSTVGTTTSAGCTACSSGKVSGPGTLGICKTCPACSGTTYSAAPPGTTTWDQVRNIYSAGSDPTRCLTNYTYYKLGAVVQSGTGTVPNSLCT